MGSGNVVEIKFNGKTILEEDAKLFVDYLSDELIKKHSKALTRRNVFIQTLDVVYKICILIVVIKFFPQFITFLFPAMGGAI